MEARSGKDGRREFIQVLRLRETLEQLLDEASVAHALDIGAVSFDAVKMIVPALEHRSPRLDLNLYPYLPRAQRHLAGVELLIIDELGYVPFTVFGADLLFVSRQSR